MNLNELQTKLSDINSDDLIKLKELVFAASDVIVLGNGGSNAISLHIAEDYHKMLGVKTIAFGDSARMSCYANDYGWENAYKMFLEHFVNPSTLVILISSSGESKNITNCAEYCEKNNIEFITLSGHKPNNYLRSLSVINDKLYFWVDSTDYGIVELTHESILHSII